MAGISALSNLAKLLLLSGTLLVLSGLKPIVAHAKELLDILGR